MKIMVTQISVEEQSFRNLVSYFYEELTQLTAGSSGNKILSISQRRTLRKHKVVVLQNLYEDDIVKTVLELTNHALRVMDELALEDGFDGSLEVITW